MLYKDWDFVLTGEHIRITPIKAQDEVPYSRLMLGELYDRFEKTLGLAPPANLTSTLNHTASDETHAIRPLADDQFIGWIALQKNDEGQPDIGISLIAEQQNKGYGPEAVMLFANRLHAVYGLSEISVRISDKNLQSQRAFAKVGAVFDKAEPDARFAGLEKVYEDTSGELRLPEGFQKPMLHYYHIPLPIAELYQLSDPAGSFSEEEVQGDEMGVIMKAAAFDELDKLARKIELAGGLDAEKVKAIIHNRMDALKNE